MKPVESDVEATDEVREALPRQESAMSVKDAVIEMIRALPEDATWADIAAEGAARFGEPDDESLTQEEWEAAWIAECERRIADRRAGRTVGIPAEQVMREMREKYG